jgi:hypothetical protein
MVEHMPAMAYLDPAESAPVGCVNDLGRFLGLLIKQRDYSV